MLESFFYGLPIWAVALTLLGTLLLMLEVGYKIGWRLSRTVNPDQRSQITTLQAAILGFLALVLSFAFSVSHNRFDTRRRLIVNEANAIGTAYLRAEMLPEPYRDRMELLLRRYLATRVPKPNVAAINRAIQQSSQLQTQIWKVLTDYTSGPGQTSTKILFTDAINEMINLQTERIAAYLYRAPPGLLLVLYCAGIFAVGVMGYCSGLDHRRNLATMWMMILLIAAVLMVILDLDQPTQGLIRANQQSLISLQQQLHALPGELPPG